ncbi:MAG TPA: aldo/keto reductase family protein [Candidatus Limnocylindrales bacterium]|nr:aldo/keto reductase family protein [Candidatus Limnocylindrales bacterium]
MEYRNLGKSGLKVSVLSLGAWLSYGHKGSEAEAIATIHRAIELGANFIDVADVYADGRAETMVGKAIAGMKRSDLVISTKAFWPMSDNVNDRGLSRKHLFESVEASLKRFGIDYVDLFFCHRFDPETPLEETVRAIADLIRQGKILYWGTSMWTAAQIDAVFDVVIKMGAYGPVVEQPKYNMLDRDVVEGPLEEAVKRHGMGLVTFSPLAQGVLTGKYNAGIPEGSRATTVDENWFNRGLSQERLDKARALDTLAREMGTTSGALALAWVIRHPQVSSAITGATRPDQVEQNFAALDVTITDEVAARIDQIIRTTAPSV